MRRLDDVAEKLKNEVVLEKNDILQMLNCDELERLFALAREIRRKNFGNKIFLYGFVYFSTFCKNDCNFCYYRKSNNIVRYRKTPDEVIEIACRLAKSGVNLIDLTMGEDVYYTENEFDAFLDIVKQIKTRTGLPVMISPGVIKDIQTERFASVGADWYALYQETNNRTLFSKLRINQDFDERINSKIFAKQKGMLIEEGILVGIGETLSDIADSIVNMGIIGASQVRVMSFVPQDGIPMQNVITPDRELELRIIAVLRILYNNALIPASLDVDGIAGLKDRINAGANVVTSIIPPFEGFAGVAQNSMDVDNGGRSVEEVSKILNEMGMEVGNSEEYNAFLEEIKGKI